ncbi:hypothetical protein [Cupriavidus oxalaticus]|uniref:Morphogenetic protein n=1 Tax=Cupriavidus oxalaticus TaxID=96344 RepID=A0A4P7LJX9_9BURK|nr:hypothetical protein [Cupriavidus oxalaticus]QBY56125.1 hypothetical protein E0W60_34265 [Cupriavidus oxalaticus]
MADRPILFSGAMVRAILDSKKTQTRRVIDERTREELRAAAAIGEIFGLPEGGAVDPRDLDYILPFCRHGKPGDRLWVRETWYCDDYRVKRGPYLKPDDLDVDEAREHGTLVYAADGLDPYEAEQPIWRPSIHMPRWASRITLEITGVRAERLNDCSEADARAEGVRGWSTTGGDGYEDDGQTAREQFVDLWNGINGAGAWHANPWVWVVEFRRAAP